MIKFALCAAALLPVAAALAADYRVHTFKKIQATDQFWCEGANSGDLNRDGHNDLVSGPYWYAGPDFKQRHEYYPATQTFKRKRPDGSEETIPGFEGLLGVNNAYSDNFIAFVHDLNRDQWPDILILGFPGKESFWYENPRGGHGHWKRYLALDVTDNESPTFTDLTGDGRLEIVCSSKGRYGYAEPDWADPTKPWTFHPISPDNKYHRFTHGLGVGDVNGDGRNDIIEKDGWWEAPASRQGDPLWKHHPFPFAPAYGSAQMYAYDVNGDGLNDVITSLAAHGYGLAWYEQIRKDGEITFTKHLILNEKTTPKSPAPAPNAYGVRFSQLHAVDLVDMDGDGLRDIITGKRIWAHGPAGDDEPNAPAVLYWFKLVRGPNRTVDFIPHLVDDDSGIGTQVVARDLNGDGLPDIVVGNKKGTFAFIHEAKKVRKSEWEKAQPKRIVIAQ